MRQKRSFINLLFSLLKCSVKQFVFRRIFSLMCLPSETTFTMTYSEFYLRLTQLSLTWPALAEDDNRPGGWEAVGVGRIYTHRKHGGSCCLAKAAQVKMIWLSGLNVVYGENLTNGRLKSAEKITLLGRLQPSLWWKTFDKWRDISFGSKDSDHKLNVTVNTVTTFVYELPVSVLKTIVQMS